jgi:serine/threonine protein kinase
VNSPDKKSKKSDVWALGVLLFVLIKGDFPFQSGKSALDAINGLKFVFDEKTSAQEHFVYPVTISKRC